MIYSITRIEWKDLYLDVVLYKQTKCPVAQKRLYGYFKSIFTGVIKKKLLFVNALTKETIQELENDLILKCFDNIIPSIDFEKYKGDYSSVYQYIQTGIIFGTRDLYNVHKKEKEIKENTVQFQEAVVNYSVSGKSDLEDLEYVNNIYRLAMEKTKIVLGSKYIILLNYIQDNKLFDVLLDPKLFIMMFEFTEHITYRVCGSFRKSVKEVINLDRKTRGLKEI